MHRRECESFQTPAQTTEVPVGRRIQITAIGGKGEAGRQGGSGQSGMNGSPGQDATKTTDATVRLSRSPLMVSYADPLAWYERRSWWEVRPVRSNIHSIKSSPINLLVPAVGPTEQTVEMVAPFMCFYTRTIHTSSCSQSGLLKVERGANRVSTEWLAKAAMVEKEEKDINGCHDLP